MHDFNLFADIKKLLIESHTKEEIKDLSTSELKKLHGEYLAKGTVEAKEEAAEIKKEIESRGQDDDSETKSETKLAEDNRASPIWNTHKPVQNWNRVADYYSILAKKEAARRAAVEKEMKAKAEAAKKKPDVAEQNEELLAILDVLCEMVGVDMMTLVEETLLEFDPNRGKAGRKIPLAQSFLDAHNQGLRGAEVNAHKRFASLSPHDQKRLNAYSRGRSFSPPHYVDENDPDYQTGSDVARSPDVEEDKVRQRRARIRAGRSRREGSPTHYTDGKQPGL